MPSVSTYVSELGCRSPEPCQQPHKWAGKWILQFHSSLEVTAALDNSLNGNLLRDSRPETPSRFASRFFTHRNSDEPLDFDIICYKEKKVTNMLYWHSPFLLPHQGWVSGWTRWYQNFSLVMEHCLEIQLLWLGPQMPDTLLLQGLNPVMYCPSLLIRSCTEWVQPN